MHRAGQADQASAKAPPPPESPAPDSSSPSRSTPPERPRAAFALLATMQVVLIAAIALIGVGLPAVQADFGLTGAQLAFVTSAYGLAFGGLLLLGGRLADLFGRRRVFLAGVVVFGVGSAAAAFAIDFWSLAATRFAQGCGAALVAPSALALLGAVFPDPVRRGRAFALWGGLNGLGATAGMLLSGVVLTWVTWRWTFVAPAAVAVLVLVLAPYVLPAPPPRRGRLDIAGAVLATAGVSALSYGLLQSGTADGGMGATSALVPSLCGMLLLATFAVVETRVREPLLPLVFLRHARRTTAVAVIHVMAAGMSTLLFLLTLYLRQVQDLPPLLTSAAFLPYCVAQLVTGAFVGRLVARAGARVVTVSGLVLVAAGLLLSSRIDAGSPYAGTLLWGLLAFAIGSALAFGAAMVLALEDVSDRQAGLAGGVVNTAMETGPTLGLAVLVALAAMRTAELNRVGVDAAGATARGYGLAFAVAAAAFVAMALLVAVVPAIRAPAAATDPPAYDTTTTKE